MKKTNISIILLFLLFGAFNCYSQSEIYKEEWAKIDSLELDGKTTSALRLVNKIKEESIENNLYQDYVKASIFRWKFIKLQQEDFYDIILKEIDSTAQGIPFPMQAIVYSLKGKFLMEYYHNNRWKISRRSKTNTTNLAELETWDIQTLIEQADAAYEKSIQFPEKLKKIPVEAVIELIDASEMNRIYRPTLFDVLANEAIPFYNTSYYLLDSTKEKFNVNNKVFFETSNHFQNAEFPTLDTISSVYEVFKIYQNIEKLHSEDTLPNAYVYSQLERISLAEKVYKKNDKIQLYRIALKNLSAAYKDYDIDALINFRLALSFKEEGDQFQYKVYGTNANAYKNALDICNEVIDNYPNTDGAQKCFILKKIILKTSLSAKAREFTYPQKTSRIFIEYKNIKNLDLNIIKLPFNFNLNKKLFSNRDSIINQIVKTSSKHFVKKINLPQGEDFNKHSIEVLLPPLKEGLYLYYLINRNIEDSLNFAYTFTNVTSMGYAKTNYSDKTVFQFFDVESGKAIKKAKIYFENEEEFGTELRTNSYGEVEVSDFNKNNKRNKLQTIIAVKNIDTLVSNEYPRYYWQDSDEKEEVNIDAKTVIFLDRNIYRPGQTVYFKGILVKKQNNKTTVVPNEYVLVYIEGANGDELLEMRLKSNEFGSFSGTYKLPINVLTGEFSITAEEDDEESEFWDNLNDYEYGYTPFSVEEYKRPTFEVVFDTVNKSYIPNDSIAITGNAKAYFGANVTQAKVAYSIKRNTYEEQDFNLRYISQDNYEEGEVTTDSAGKFSIEFIAKPTNNENLQQFIYYYTVSVSVTDINGETRTANTIVKVGYKNLITLLEVPKKVSTDSLLNISLSTKNLNDHLKPSTGTIKIYKLKGSQRILNSRIWEEPQIQQISKKDFITYFPHEPYNVEDHIIKKGNLVYNTNFSSNGVFLKEIPVSSDWENGKYILVAEAKDEKGNVKVSESEFIVENPNAKYLADGELFQYSIINTDFKKDGFVKVNLQTAAKNLIVFVEAFYKGERVFNKIFKVDGNQILKIPLKSYYKHGIKLRFKWMFYSVFYYKNQAANFKPEKEDFLSIETKSFRNKLLPGQEENWSFTIKNSTDDKQAEVLVSMYDMALDQFKESYWDIDFTVGDFNETNIPYIEAGKSLQITNFSVRNPNSYLKFRIANYDKLNLFGLSFSESTYSYRNYLRKLKLQLDKNDISRPIYGNINGSVLDSSGLPLPGVNVIIKGTKVTTQTDFDGEFAVDAKKGETIVFTYLGYITEEVKVNSTPIFITMQADEAVLDEVVVTALGIKRKNSNLTYNFESETASFLEGKVSGLNVNRETSEIGTILLRGNRSLSGYKDMLIVVDGVIMSSEELSAINPSEIQGINTLKGVEGLALYGNDGANGVLIVNTKKGIASLTQVKARKNLHETAFFFPHLTTNKQGDINFNFTSPEALTRWKFRLFAHTKDLTLGGIEKEVITQKQLSIVTNVPRFFRENDTVVFSVKIANLEAQAIRGNAILQLFDAITMEAVDVKLNNINNIQPFTIKPSENTSLSWNLIIPKGIEAITYKIIAKAGSFSDGEESIIPVLSNRTLVTETIPFLVRAGKKEIYELKNLKETTSTTLTNHKFTIEYTSNPIWYALQSLPYLMEFPYECAEQTFSRLYANCIASHILNNNKKLKEVFKQWKGNGVLKSDLEKNETFKSILIAETPWLRDAENETEQKKRLALLFDTDKTDAAISENIIKLKQFQNTDGGFPWFSGGKSNYYITRHIVSGFGHLQKMGISLETENVLSNAIKYMDSQFADSFDNYKKQKIDSLKFHNFPSHLHYLYARSFFIESNPVDKNIQSIIDEILNIQNDEWILKSVYEKGLLALGNYRMGYKKTAQLILDALNESAVKSKINGMYWKDNKPGLYWYQAPIETQALIIEAFSEISNNIETIEELKVWLLQQKRTRNWPSTKATSEAIYALMLQGNDFTSIAENTEITVGTQKINSKKLAPLAKEAGSGYFKLNWKKDKITKEMASVSVVNNGNTNGYGGMYWQYFEDLDKISDDEKGVLQVEKDLFIKKPNTESLMKIVPKTIINRGDLITVRLKIQAKSDMEFIHLKDMRASGIEPIDVLSEYKYREGTSYYQSTKDVATHFFFDRLLKGTYIIEYKVRANNIGDFSNGIATIESMYAPEFSSHTKGTRIQIK